MKHFVRVWGIGVAVCTLAQVAKAQSIEERAGARAAAEQGLKAYQEERWADAADLMARAEKILHAPTHLLYQARAEERLGHLVVAHELYLRIVREQLGRDAPPAFVSAKAEAKERSDAIRSRLCQVSIIVEGGPAGVPVRVTVDDVPVPPALLGVPYPVDPGEHRFEATVEGMSSGTVVAKLREGSAEKIVLKVKASDSGPSGAAPSEQAPLARLDSTSPRASEPVLVESSARPSGTHPLKIGAYVGLGVGVVGVGIGTFFVLRSTSLRADATALCNGPGGKCPEESRARVEDLDKQANNAGTLSIVGFSAGGVGLAAGVVMLLLAPAHERPSHAATLSPYIDAHGGGLWGRF